VVWLVFFNFGIREFQIEGPLIDDVICLNLKFVYYLYKLKICLLKKYQLLFRQFIDGIRLLKLLKKRLIFSILSIEQTLHLILIFINTHW